MILNNELEAIRKKLVVGYFEILYPEFRLKGLRKATENPRSDIWYTIQVKTRHFPEKK
jgi:hypothetical protein